MYILEIVDNILTVKNAVTQAIVYSALLQNISTNVFYYTKRIMFSASNKELLILNLSDIVNTNGTAIFTNSDTNIEINNKLTSLGF